MTSPGITRSTDDLIQSIVSELRPVPRLAMTRRLALGVGTGAALSALLLVTLLGARPDLAHVLTVASFWSKLAFTLAIAGVSLLVAARLGRPGSRTNILWLLPVPFLMYLPVGIWELAHTDPSQWGSLLIGHGWKECTWLVLLLSIPVYVGLLWSFRRFAPTEVEVTGAVAGLSASAVAAAVYSIHCPANTAVFALVWYTLAFVIASLAGVFLGHRLLRW